MRDLLVTDSDSLVKYFGNLYQLRIYIFMLALHCKYLFIQNNVTITFLLLFLRGNSLPRNRPLHRLQVLYLTQKVTAQNICLCQCILFGAELVEVIGFNLS